MGLEDVWAQAKVVDDGASPATPAGGNAAPPEETPEEIAAEADTPSGDDQTEDTPSEPLEEPKVEDFLDDEGRINWKTLDAKPWPDEMKASFKGTLLAHKRAIDDRNSRKWGETATENRVLKAQLDELRKQNDLLARMARGKPTAEEGGDDGTATEPGDQAILEAIRKDSDCQWLIENGHATEEQLLRQAKVTQKFALKETEPRLRQISEMEAQRTGREEFEKAKARFKVDPTHPVHLKDLEPHIADVVQKYPWVKKNLDAIASEEGAKPEDVIEYAYQTTLTLRPELRAKLAAPPPKPGSTAAPGKAGAAPVIGAAPASGTGKPKPEALSDAFVKACQQAS